MKKYEILYDWPFAQIQRLADSDEAEEFAGALDAGALGSFTTLTEQMRGLGADMTAAKAARQHFPKWEELRICLDSFEQQFANFPGASIPKFRLFVLLAGKLFQTAPPLDAVDVDETAFEIRAISEQLPLSWFSRENGQSVLESMAVFSCGNLTALEAEIAPWNLSPIFAFHLLAALQALPALPPGHAAFVKRPMQPVTNEAVEAFARMVVLTTGRPVHSARRYLKTPRVIDPDIIRVGNSYQQWGEVLNVLSEYNSREDVLLKYLTIYHVIENFMFKLPIVVLERQQNGRMFSIRDFRRLYQRVEMAEGDALKQLFTSIFQMQASPGVTFEQHIVSRWTNLVPGMPQADVDRALVTLGLSFNFSGFAGQAAAGTFAKLVYAIRNAIVHNKETEFHLTYASLDSRVCSVIEVFLIPALEEICFSLIGSPNPQLWYQNRELLFYQ
jgi:hypothetical protein